MLDEGCVSGLVNGRIAKPSRCAILLIPMNSLASVICFARLSLDEFIMLLLNYAVGENGIGSMIYPKLSIAAFYVLAMSTGIMSPTLLEIINFLVFFSITDFYYTRSFL